MRNKHYTFILLVCSIQLIACSSSKKFAATTQPNLLSDSNLLNAHVGISIYDPSTNKYLYTHQADKYFIPASNTKLFTCYAAMKHLGDSLVGLRYFYLDSTVVFQGAGDPTLLHPDFTKQPVLSFLKQQKQLAIKEAEFPAERWALGWNIADISSSYMPERSEMPVYGNVIRIRRSGDSIAIIPRILKNNITDTVFKNWRIDFERTSLNDNFFRPKPGSQNFSYQEIPFITGKFMTSWVLLIDTIKKNISLYSGKEKSSLKFHSQPTDSLLKPMMHRSDNFFAEQTLLMVSNEMTGVMNDTKIIDSLLKTDLKDLPQKPRWVDGSGLSRYNLFSPNDLIHVLSKIKNEFDWNRITTILPTGGEGTLSNYYINLKDKIFGKTGTLSNNIALSGYLITKQNKTLIFSLLVNNHMGNTTQIRRAVEKFLSEVAEKN